MQIRLTILWTFIFFTSLSSLANTVSIKGIIKDSTSHQVIEGASVLIKELNTTTITNAFGAYTIKNIAPGNYTLHITHIGYEPREAVVKVEAGITAVVNVFIKRTSVTLSSVSISAQKDDIINTISSIDFQLRTINTSQDLLRMVPGLFIAQHQGGGKAEQIFLRGFDADHGTDVNISVDNMPVNMVSHAHGQGYADTHFIIPESIQDIEYGKGPYQIDKGNLCTAGFVAYKTRNTLDDNFIILDNGMYDYLRTVAGLNLLRKKKAWQTHQDTYIMAEYAHDRGYFDLPEQYNRLNLFGKYTNYISSDKTFNVTLSGYNSSWDASGQIPSRAIADGIVSRFGCIDPEGGHTSRYNLNMQYHQNVGYNSYLETNVFATYYTFKLYSDFTYYLTDTVNGDQIRQAESRIMTGWNSHYSTDYYIHNIKMTTQVGLGIRYDDVMNDELSHTANMSVLINPIELGDVHETNAYGYINQKIYLSPRLVLQAGTRYDLFIQQYDNYLVTDHTTSTFTNGKFSPKVGIYYNISNKAHIYYSYGTGFHSNDTRTLALGEQSGDPLIVNHTTPSVYSNDLDIIIKPYSKLLVSAAVWLIDLQQEYTYDGDVAIIDTAGRTRRYGVDASARYQLFKWLYCDADVNFAHVRALDEPNRQNYLPLAPAFTSTGGITFRPNKHLSASLRYRHMNNRPANADYSLTAVGYTVWDMVVQYTRQKCTIGLHIQNIFNTIWDEAQFATTTRLKYATGQLEHSPVTDVCFTPGTPICLKLSASYKF